MDLEISSILIRLGPTAIKFARMNEREGTTISFPNPFGSLVNTMINIHRSLDLVVIDHNNNLNVYHTSKHEGWDC